MRTALVVLFVVSFPFIYEGTLICVSRWKAMFGKFESVRTPFLDFVANLFQNARSDVGRFHLTTFQGVDWKPAVVIPMAIVWTGLAALMLRRG